MAIHCPNPLIERLLLALGLEPAETQRVVIEIPADDVVKVYAVLLPNNDDLTRVCEVFETQATLVKAVTADNDATIHVTHKPKEHAQ